MPDLIRTCDDSKLPIIRSGLERIVYRSGEMAAPETIRLTSDAFGDNEPIPSRFTDDGERLSPPLSFENIPTAAKSLALIVEDADSATPAPLCHALIWDMVPQDGTLGEAALDGDAPCARQGGVIGQNSFLALGWLPPDPPPGHGPHRYALQIYALDYRPDLDEGSFRIPIVNALQGHILAKGLLVGTYERRR
jgi:Raf kinase inhibitor-like YbhB/YbcL family protein